MVDDDEYEIVPIEEVKRLKEEIEELKSGKTSISKTSLTAKLDDMLELFREAAAEMEEEEPINRKIDILLDQNTKIAEGIVALADMIKELKDEIAKSKIARPVPRPISNIPMHEPRPIAAGPLPRLQMPMPLEPLQPLEPPKTPIDTMMPLPPRPRKRW